MPFQYLDTRDVHLTPRLLLGLERSPLLPVLERFVQPGACLLEVGAGQGYHTLAVAGRFDPGRVIAHESDPIRFATLRDNVLAHDLTGRVDLRPHAVHSWQDLEWPAQDPALVRVAAPSAVSAALDAWERRPNCRTTLLLRWTGEPAVLDRLAALGLRPWRVGAGGRLLPAERQALLGTAELPVDLLAGRNLGLGER